MLNLGELYYIFLRNHSKKVADCWLKKIKFDLINITPDLIIKAVYFRWLNRKMKLSLIDCVGYVTTLQYGLKFLTGDKQFEGVEGVEFVK